MNEKLVTLAKEYRASMDEDVLRSWVGDIIPEMEKSTNPIIQDLLSEYRNSMNFDILHAWSEDVAYHIF